MLKAMRPGHRLLAAILVLYLVVLAFVVLWPTPVDKDAGRHLTHTLAWLYAHGIPRWFSYPLLEWLSNVAMFLPFGFLVAEMLERGAWWKATIAGLAFSTAIEMIQFLFFVQRTASVLDVLANTLGALVGAAAFMVFAKIRHKHANIVNGVPGSLVGDSSIDPKKN